MSKYSYLRGYYKNLIKHNCLYCILSGLKITDKKDLSLDHYVPKALDEGGNTLDPRNIYPSIRIINNLKSNLLPCVWENEKFDILYKATQHYRLNEHDYNIVVLALNNIENYYINPCQWCINNIKCKAH